MKYLKKTTFISIVLLLSGCNTSISDKLILQINDALNMETIGYKSVLKDIDNVASFKSTLGDFDFVIRKENGYFKLLDKSRNKTLYTRNGMFFPNNEAILVNSDGFILQPEIKLDVNKLLEYQKLNEKDDFLDNKDRTKKIDYPILDKIVVFKRAGTEYTREGNYFLFNSVEEEKEPLLIQGALELSNVEPIEILLQIENSISMLDSEHLKFNTEFKMGLIKELREKYMDLIYRSKSGGFNSLRAFENSYEYFCEIKNKYLNMIKSEIDS